MKWLRVRLRPVSTSLCSFYCQVIIASLSLAYPPTLTAGAGAGGNVLAAVAAAEEAQKAAQQMKQKTASVEAAAAASDGSPAVPRTEEGTGEISPSEAAANAVAARKSRLSVGAQVTPAGFFFFSRFCAVTLCSVSPVVFHGVQL